jgi:hypothetical protein
MSKNDVIPNVIHESCRQEVQLTVLWFTTTAVNVGSDFTSRPNKPHLTRQVRTADVKRDEVSRADRGVLRYNSV